MVTGGDTLDGRIGGAARMAGTTRIAGSAGSRTKQARSRQRRLLLLEATLRLVAREGVPAVTHRSVAAEAGVPTTSTTYYFASKEELIAEAFALHAEREAQRVAVAALTPGVPTEARGEGRRNLARKLAEFVAEGLASGRQNLLAEYELLLHAARRPELEVLTRRWQQGILEALRVTLDRLGSPDAAVEARVVLAVISGLEVDSLATPRSTLDVGELETLMVRVLCGPQPFTSASGS